MQARKGAGNPRLQAGGQDRQTWRQEVPDETGCKRRVDRHSVIFFPGELMG